MVFAGLVGCTDSPTDPGDGGPTLPVFNLRTSIDTSTNAKLAPAQTQLTGFNSVFAPLSRFGSVSSKKSGNTWTWTRTSDSLTETITAMKKMDGGFGWTRLLNGSSGGTSFTNWVAWLGSTNASGSTGSWTIHNKPGDSTSSTLDWSTDSAKVLMATLQNLNGLRLLDKHVATSRPDLSGWLRNYSDSSTVADRWVWLTTGHGSYFTYPFPGDASPDFTW
jgi:hypothetical protein